MIGIKPVSVPGSFATRLDPRSVSPHGGATLAGKLPAPRGELIQERGPETALSARRVTAGTAAAVAGASDASTRVEAQGADCAGGHARVPHDIAPPSTRGAAPESAAQRRSANAQVLSAVMSNPGTPPSAALGILLRMADPMATQDAALLSTGTSALARRLAGEPASQRQAYLAIVATAHQQGRIGETAYGALMTQLGGAP